jgi:integrase
VKFVELAEQVLAQRERDGVRGLDRELSRYRCHIECAAFASKDITEITAPDIRDWLRLMAEKNAMGPGPVRKLARQTINRCQSLVSAVCNEAVDRELIVTNPNNGVKSKKRVDESDTKEKWAYLTPAEQQAIVACVEIPRADKLAVLFAIHTGLRQGEQRHLRLEDLIIDGDNPRVLVRVAGRCKKTGKDLPPKSGKKREVPLLPEALAVTREWVLKALPAFAPNNPENLVFPTASGKLRQQGKPLGRTGTLKGHYRAAGVKLRSHLHWHALRHTFASNLVAGVYGRQWKLEEIQILMGHSSITITQRYAHLGEDAIKRAVRETIEAVTPRAVLPEAVVETSIKPPAVSRLRAWFTNGLRRLVEVRNAA